SIIGEVPYRYQGVVHHALLAALASEWTRRNLNTAARIPGVPGLIGKGLASLAGLLAVTPNAGYAIGSIADGRTGPIPRVQDQLPPAPLYPPALADELRQNFKK